MRRDIADLQNQLREAEFQSTRLREARPSKKCHPSLRKLFQSTRLREARLFRTTAKWYLIMFQSTRLREARLNAGVQTYTRTGFNPRAYVRRDLCVFSV